MITKDVYVIEASTVGTVQQLGLSSITTNERHMNGTSSKSNKRGGKCWITISSCIIKMNALSAESSPLHASMTHACACIAWLTVHACSNSISGILHAYSAPEHVMVYTVQVPLESVHDL